MIKFRRIISFSLTIAVIMSYMVYAFAYSINDQGSETPAVSGEDLEYISNLGSEKYDHLLDVWREGVPYSSSEEANYPSFYGGCYEDDNKYLVIAVTSLDQEVIDYFESLIDLDYVRFTLVQDSYQKLLDEKEVMGQLLCSGAFGETVTESFTGIGISIEKNSLNIYLSSEDSATCNTIKKVYASHSDRPCKLRFLLGFHHGFLAPSALEADQQNNPPQPHIVNGTFMEPGGPILIHGSEWSVGFGAKDYFGNLRVVTANHGSLLYGDKAYGVKTSDNPNEPKDSDNPYFGFVTNTCYSGSVDASFVQRADTRFAPITYVYGWDFYLKPETIEIMEGMEVFKKGVITGGTRGTVCDPSVDLSSAPNSTVKLTSVVLANCYADEGDSGGIVASGGTTSSRYVAGIVGGGVVNKFDPSKRYMYFSPASDVLSKLRVTIYG